MRAGRERNSLKEGWEYSHIRKVMGGRTLRRSQSETAFLAFSWQLDLGAHEWSRGKRGEKKRWVKIKGYFSSHCQCSSRRGRFVTLLITQLLNKIKSPKQHGSSYCYGEAIHCWIRNVHLKLARIRWCLFCRWVFFLLLLKTNFNIKARRHLKS